jgi:hypothetical protein
MEKGEGGSREAEQYGKRRDRFIKVMADYFNIPMRVRSIRCLMQFNNPCLGNPASVIVLNPGDMFLADT